MSMNKSLPFLSNNDTAKMPRLSLTLLLILTSLFTTVAQSNFSLEGSVHNASSNASIKARIKIVLSAESNGESVLFPSNPDGSFLIPNLVGGKDYVFYVKAKGYFPFADTLLATETDSIAVLSKNFKLKPVKVGETMSLDGVLFEEGTSNMLPSSYGALDLLLETLRDNPEMKIRLEGHTDNSGSKKSSIELSERRVNTVRFYLVNRGIDKKRITGKGFGGAKPIANNSSAENRAKNRRVEFKILSN